MMDRFARYHRQMLLPGFGRAAQQRLRARQVVLIGCGALGSVIADMLTRAGVGRLRIVDRDLVELTNLQRQVLFTEDDATRAVPKAVAAAERLAAVNSEVAVEPVVADFTHRNAERLAEGADVVVDGTDNFETRLLINDVAVAHGLPYVYGGAIGTTGVAYPVLAHAGGESPWERAGVAGPCLRCLLGGEPDTGQLGSCDTVGVLGPAAGIVANFEAAETLKILTGNIAAVSRTLLSFDLGSNRVRQVEVAGAVDADCPCCGQRRFDYLDGRRAGRAATLCGRGAVQLQPGTLQAEDLALDRLADQLAAHGPVRANEHVLRATLTDAGQPYRLTVFPDGRAIIHGTEDPATARSLYTRYVGL